MLNQSLLLISTLLITACAGSYKIPEQADSAEITIVHSLPVFPSSTTVNVFDNEACQQNERSGRLAKVGNDTMIKDKIVTIKVQAGEPIFLASHLWKESGSEQYGYLNFHCSNLVSFTPQKNVQYKMKAKAVKNMQCELQIVEKKSQLPPIDLTLLKTREACNKTGMFDL